MVYSVVPGLSKLPFTRSETSCLKNRSSQYLMLPRPRVNKEEEDLPGLGWSTNNLTTMDAPSEEIDILQSEFPIQTDE
ncbi:hypothetical protein AFLA_009102 [Aspergillus flavus NRRL3357]|nr:hypothetical protein AFLA_009102 [Aspergillus flavus NRRL3357]